MSVTNVMKAFQQTGYDVDAAKAVTMSDSVAIPEPGKDEVLIQVQASCLNAGDAFMGRGGAKALFSLPFPTTIGRDLAGTVVSVGPDTKTDLRPGDRVVGYVPVGGGRGSFAQYVALPAHHAEKIPDSITFTDACTIPTAGCTTYQALVEGGVLKGDMAGKRILILGGSTANGLIAIQLAKAYGCTEIATTSSQVELCRSLGATRVINHRAGEEWSAILSRHPQAGGATGGGEGGGQAGKEEEQGYDIIYDCIEGLSAWRNASKVLKPTGASYVSLVMDDAHSPVTISSMFTFMARVAYRWLWSWAGYVPFTWVINADSTKGLKELVQLMEQGKIKAVLDGAPRPATMESFTEMWRVQQGGRAHGKLVMHW